MINHIECVGRYATLFLPFLTSHRKGRQWILNENQQAERGNTDADADCHQFPICSHEEKKRALFAYLIIA